MSEPANKLYQSTRRDLVTRELKAPIFSFSFHIFRLNIDNTSSSYLNKERVNTFCDNFKFRSS